MKLIILTIRLEILYRLAKFTTKLSNWFCDKHSELHQEWKEEFIQQKIEKYKTESEESK